MIGPGGFMAGPKKNLRCCANCMHWRKKQYIHCQCSGPWGGDIYGDKNCTFMARKARSNGQGQRGDDGLIVGDSAAPDGSAAPEPSSGD